jgi:RimJ/RimL family protein N-acetyltransferase
MPFAEILTERLALRQLMPADARKIFEYRSRPEVFRFQSWGIESKAGIQSQIDRLLTAEPGEAGLWYQIQDRLTIEQRTDRRLRFSYSQI